MISTSHTLHEFVTNFTVKFQTSKEANKQLEFALKSYHENKEVERAVDYIQDKVRRLLFDKQIPD